MKQVFAQILGMDTQELRSDEALLNIGMDSLVGIEAKTKLEEELGISLPIELLIVGPSILELTESIIPLLTITPPQIESAQRDVPLPVSQKDIQLWIVRRKPNPQARVKLFCFPQGGGGASQYGDWQAMLPNYIEVCPVQLPGKENRIREKAFTDIDKATEVLQQILVAELDRPYAFYGHSAGALLAYRLAYKLWNELENKPVHLFVGAYSSPTILPNPLLALTTEKFKAKGYADIPDLGSLSSMTLEQRDEIATLLPVPSGPSIELLRSFLPTALADLQMVGSHTLADNLVFDVPITAIHGKQDDKVSEQEMKAWRELTKGSFNFYTLSGDHLFLHEQQNQRQLLELIFQELEKYS